MSRPPSEPPVPIRDPGAADVRRVGRVSEYLGGRLVLAGLVSGAVGLALLGYAAWKAWRAVVGHHLSTDLMPVFVAGILAFALLSLSRSARRTGAKYLTGDRSIARDIGRTVAKRAARRRR